MQAVGVVRKIDYMGRVVLPKELRDRFGLKPGTPLEFLINEYGDIVLQQPADYEPGGKDRQDQDAVERAIETIDRYLAGEVVDVQELRECFRVLKDALAQK